MPPPNESETQVYHLSSHIAEVEYQVRDLEELMVKEQHDKQHSKEELTEEVKRQKREVKVWKY